MQSTRTIQQNGKTATIDQVISSLETQYQFRVWSPKNGFLAYGKRPTLEAAEAAARVVLKAKGV